MIDLNLAFDANFEGNRFWQRHVFADLATIWPTEFKARLNGQMHAAMARLPDIWNNLPDEWRSPECGVGLDLAEVERCLRRFEINPDEFWAIRK